MKILIADDDPVTRRLLEATLVRFGHEVVQVSDGVEALDALSHPNGPRLAILDWEMPGTDGLAACRIIRKRPSYIYVILLTTRDRREDVVVALDAGADDFLTKPFDNLELGARIRSGERVLRLQQELIQAHEALHYQATHDQLTGLYNRGRILELLGAELTRARREHRPLSVVIADIDHFKDINDKYGHQIGDEVLRQVGQRMYSVCGERDSVGRHGGEEFLFVLPGCGATQVPDVGERLRDAIGREPLHVGRLEIAMTISVGVASSERSEDPSGALIHAADEALYRAKAAGRNRVESSVIVVR